MALRDIVEYNTWSSMKQRCLNPNNPHYKYYGGRGIKICDRWLNSFENFFTDMGKRPKGKYSIDRIDNYGNYEPENCRWVKTELQALNKSNVFPNNEIYRSIVLQVKKFESRKPYNTNKE